MLFNVVDTKNLVHEKQNSLNFLNYVLSIHHSLNRTILLGISEELEIKAW